MTDPASAPKQGDEGAPDAWLAVVYLIFNEGYGGRGDLAAEAIRLGRPFAELMPDEAEVHGLLALMLVNEARSDARFADGTVVLLRDQDRSLWDFDQIAEGQAALDRALALGGRDPYVLQAAITALHVEEPQNWPQIAALYGELARLTGSSVVELNQAVAIVEAGEVEARSRWWNASSSTATTICARRTRICCAARPRRRRPRGLRPGARARSLGRRAALPRAAADGAPWLTGSSSPSRGVHHARAGQALVDRPSLSAAPCPSAGRTRCVAMFLVVLHRSGPQWDPSRPMEEQSDWPAHASFMDRLVDAGLVVLGGPLADEHRVVHAVGAESEEAVRATLARDPWSGTHLRVDTIEPWTIRLDGRGAVARSRS